MGYEWDMNGIWMGYELEDRGILYTPNQLFLRVWYPLKNGGLNPQNGQCNGKWSEVGGVSHMVIVVKNSLI